jgi:hypothetical protein
MLSDYQLRQLTSESSKRISRKAERSGAAKPWRNRNRAQGPAGAQCLSDRSIVEPKVLDTAYCEFDTEQPALFGARGRAIDPKNFLVAGLLALEEINDPSSRSRVPNHTE